MKKKIIIFYPLYLTSKESGSQVRPNKIYKAFLNKGYDVFLLSGNVDDRKKRFEELKKAGDIKEYAFCYSEIPTYPINPIIDYRIFSLIHKNKIPIGIYYRDAYWKFSEYFQKKQPRKTILKIRYRADLRLLNKVATAFFFPSSSFSKIIKTKTEKIVLPPGGEIKDEKFYQRKFKEKMTGIYVGGVSKRYGLEILLEAFEYVNQKSNVNLLLVCREDEFEERKKVFSKFINKKWLLIKHKSGEDLKRLYCEADFGIIPLKKDNYNDLALPVKMFEYLSYGLPIVATRCDEVEKFTKINKIGITCDDNEKSLALAISEMIENKENYEKIRKNILPTLGAGNLWEDRVKKIDGSLTRR